MKNNGKMEKNEGNWYFITGVSGVDPFTGIEYVQSNNKDKVYVSDDLYIDGSMLNIIRKYLKEKTEFAGIYIYLTDDMARYKQIYREAIEFLCKNYKNSVEIHFYPEDEHKYRKKDVHVFGSFYGEIYGIYNDIKNNDKKVKPENIVLNVTSGTPAFEADMMLMGVINGLKIEQTSNIVDIIDEEKKVSVSDQLKDYAKNNDTTKFENGQTIDNFNIKSSKIIYKESINEDLLDEKLEAKEEKIKKELEKIKNSIDNDINEILKKLEKLYNIENNIEKEKELESIKDSIQKKDYTNDGSLDDSIEKLEKLNEINNKTKILELLDNIQKKYYPSESGLDDNIKKVIILKRLERLERLEKLKRLDKTENSIDNRTKTLDIDKTKQIILLESIKDSIRKKDYAGIYDSILENKEYLTKNKIELLRISKNLYKRYIGYDAEEDFILTHKNDMNEIKKFYPIFEIQFAEDQRENFKKARTLNDIIEKFNIMKVKSKRDEINDWLLITTPLLEAISKEIVSMYSKIDFDNILIKNYKHEIVISFAEFEKKYKNKVSSNIIDKVRDNDNNYLNEHFYKDMFEALRKDSKNKQEENKINDILDKVYLIDMARKNRVDAAHSIENIGKKTFENKYSEKLKYSNKFGKKDESNSIKSICLIETQFKELIKELLPATANEKIFDESLNIFETLENKILKLLEDEIYDLGDKVNE